MRGKVVNVCMALLNLLIGALIIAYTLKIPREITELTVQEYQIIKVLKIVIYIAFGIITAINLINYFWNDRNSIRKTGYLIGVFSIAFIFIKEWPIAIFSILSTFIILFATLRERWVEQNSITAISIIGIIRSCCGYCHWGMFHLQKLRKLYIR